MADREPTPEQRAAISSRGEVAVRAGAGSGKTTVLAERFVHLLRPGTHGVATPEVTRLLAITFTEKAAAEMRGRIRTLVAREMELRPEERGHWARVRRDLLGAHISTIHAFCARVVREHPIQTGVDPDARVLDADEARRYLDARVEDHLLDLAAAGHPGAGPVLRRGRGLRGGRGGGAVGTVIRLLEALARLGRSGAWLAQVAERAAPPETSADAIGAMIEALEGAVERKLAERRTSKGALRLAGGWPVWRDVLRRLASADVDALAAAAPAIEALATALAAARVGPGAGELLRLDRGRLRGRLVESVASRVMRPEGAAVADLVARVEERLRADKRRDAVLTFDDLVLIARDLVKAHAPVRTALARRFDAVLLDECQDTDPAQAELLQALTQGGGPELFVVGDEKQAIYGFRGADVEVFERLLRELPTRCALGLNFRSVPSILAFVNAMGDRLLRRPPDATVPGAWTAFGPDHVLRPDRTEATPPTAVRLVTVAREIESRAITRAAPRRELEARVLAEVLRDLVSGPGAVRPGDVTVLLRSLREVKIYEYALARRDVPYHVVGGRGFFQCQEVRDVRGLLALVADPGDELALAAVLRSPWVGVPDDVLWTLVRDGRRLRAAFEVAAGADDALPALRRFSEVLAELLRLRSRASVSEVLVRGLEALDLDVVLLALPQGEQRAANVRKVLDLARGFERGAHGELPEFVAWLRRRDADTADEPEALLASEESDVVRVMTIHQAKGLEFPVVVLADLGRPVRIDYETLVVDEEAGVVAAPLVGAGGHALWPGEIVRHRERLLERARAEHARLFYVACTRARDRLVLIDGTTDPNRAAADVWGRAVWDVLGRERVREAGAATAGTLVEIAPGSHVVIEPASRWLADAPASWRAAPRRVAAATADARSIVEEAVAPVPGGPAVVECTPTDLAEFRTCPRRWWYRSVLGIRESGVDGRRARVLGALVHGALERWACGAAGDAGSALGPSLALRVPDPAGRAELARDVERAIAWLDAERVGGTRVVGSEVPFAVALGRDVVVRGRIDVVLERDGGLVLRDYKYARPPAVADAAYEGQLALYALAMARAGSRAVRTELLYLRPEPAARAVSVPDAAEAEAAAVQTARALGAARSAGDGASFSRGPADATECRRLGCGYVRRCWVSGSDPDAPARTAGA